MIIFMEDMQSRADLRLSISLNSFLCKLMNVNGANEEEGNYGCQLVISLRIRNIHSFIHSST